MWKENRVETKKEARDEGERGVGHEGEHRGSAIDATSLSHTRIPDERASALQRAKTINVVNARRERVANPIEHRSSFRPGALGLSEEEWALLKSVVATQRKRRNASH